MIKKCLGGYDQNWVWPVWSQDSEIDCTQEWTDGMNWFFVSRRKFRNAKSYFSNFWVGLVKNWHGHSAVLKNEFMDWFNFVHADCDAIFLVRTTSYSRSLTFKRQSAAVALVGPTAVAGMVLWNRVCRSFCPVVCPSVFLELDH